jgi:hypothetical protein
MFPRVERVTAYARAHTLARRTPEQLRRLRAAKQAANLRHNRIYKARRKAAA